jgi:membrane protease YdiL (CAAX protease family)
MTKKRPSVLLSLLLFFIFLITLQALSWFGVEITQVSPWVFIILMFLYYPFMFVCLIFFNRFQGFTLKKMGFRRPRNSSRLMLFGIFLGAVSSVSIVVYFGIFQRAAAIPVPITPRGADPLAEAITFAILLPLLLAFAAIEEGIFRGYIQRVFRLRYGFVTALLVASFLFAIIHFPFAGIVQVYNIVPAQTWDVALVYLINMFFAILPLGLFFGYVYRKTGENLICPVAFHATYNFLSVLAQYYLGMNLFSTLILAPGGSVLVLLLWAATVGAVIFLTRSFLKVKR